MAGRGLRRRTIAEINIVPYIDVMLVLLVIFMITAPLLNLGVEVDLPQADARPLPPNAQDPLILVVDHEGAYYLNLADDPEQAISAEEVLARSAAVLRRNPLISVLVQADTSVSYGTVMQAMVLLQRAGADKVGLSTDIPEE